MSSEPSDCEVVWLVFWPCSEALFFFSRLCFKVCGERWVIDFKHAIQNFCAVTGNFKGIHFMHPIARASAVTGTIRGIQFVHPIYLQRFCSHWKLREWFRAPNPTKLQQSLKTVEQFLCSDLLEIKTAWICKSWKFAKHSEAHKTTITKVFLCCDMSESSVNGMQNEDKLLWDCRLSFTRWPRAATKSYCIQLAEETTSSKSF